jgi:hypothetical protein
MTAPRTHKHDDLQQDVVVHGARLGKLGKEVEQVMALHESAKVELRHVQISEASEHLHKHVRGHRVILQDQDQLLHIRAVPPL